MKHHFRKVFLWTALLVMGTFLGGLSVVAAAATAETDDVIARVGDEVITFRSLDVTINSSGMVGMPIPKPGTPERTNMRLTLLDRRITSDLLYLDALDQHLDQNPVFLSDVGQYSDTILARMYRQKYLIGDIPVSDEEIRAYYEANFTDDTPFTSDIHASIEAVLRKQKYLLKVNTQRERLREGSDVQVFEDRLDPGGDSQRKSSQVVAIAGGESLTWGQVRQRLIKASQDDSPTGRREGLEELIDTRIMVQKARAAGLEQDVDYQRRIEEFRKSSLVNIHRAQLEEEWSPSDEEIRQFYQENRARIAVPETRNVQMVVVNTEAEAAAVREEIESGEITFYQAASQYSIDPNAKMSLGELGWVPKGSGFPELDAVTFALNPNEIGGPVESPAGWHLVQVHEVREGRFEDIEDRETWKQARRLLIHDKESRYVAELRRTRFPVEVYDDVFTRLTQEEVDAEAASRQAGMSSDDS